MDRIIMKNMAFYGYHGVLEEEQTLGQHFFVDAELYLDLREAGKTDDLATTVDYGSVFGLIENIVENERFKLIEALADRIGSVILADYPGVEKVIIEVRKPEAPIQGVFDYVAVNIERRRESSNG